MHSIENRPVAGPEHFSLHAFVRNLFGPENAWVGAVKVLSVKLKAVKLDSS